MGAALVYHETHQFVRLVQIMPLERSTWAFLVPMQRSGAPLPRATLVQRCLNDQVRRESCLCRTRWRAVPAGGSSSNPKDACRGSDRASNCPCATAAPLPAPHIGQNQSEATRARHVPYAQAVLRFVAENARRAAASGAGAQLQVAFFAVLTAEVLQATPKRLDEGTVVSALLLCVLLRTSEQARAAGTPDAE